MSIRSTRPAGQPTDPAEARLRAVLAHYRAEQADTRDPELRRLCRREIARLEEELLDYAAPFAETNPPTGQEPPQPMRDWQPAEDEPEEAARA